MNAIIVMAIGEKYTRLFNQLRPQFERYATRCNAELIVCADAPDRSFKRNLLAQKMLLPHLYRACRWIAFIDLDVLIAEDAPSIFNYADESKAFAAVVDQRGSQPFANVVNHFWHLPRILEETHQSYFRDRGFPGHSFNVASINGGVFLCKPAAIADLFRDFYFSGFGEMPHEEAMMAYVSQSHNLFFELDPRFNDQIIYEVYKDPGAPVVAATKGIHFRLLRKLQGRVQLPAWTYPSAYRAMIRETLKTNYIVHFSANFPFDNRYRLSR